MQAWVLDSNPGLLPKDKSDVALVVEKIGIIPMPLQSRDDLMAELQVLSLWLYFQAAQRLWLFCLSALGCPLRMLPIRHALRTVGPRLQRGAAAVARQQPDQ